jgi:hypothetical protein
MKNIEQRAEKKRQQFEKDTEERRQQMEEEIKLEKKRIDEGVIYGNRYDAYNIEHINKITDTEFLYQMSIHMVPSAQPPTQEEYDELMERCKAVDARLQFMLLESM